MTPALVRVDDGGAAVAAHARLHRCPSCGGTFAARARALERAVLRVARPPFGTSLLAVAARSDGATAP